MIAVVITAIIVTGAYGVLSTSKIFSSSGRIITSVNIGVYRNSAATQVLTAIDWGNLTAGSSATYTLYVKNTGNVREVLSMTTDDWVPSLASQYITITWNRNNTAINANQVLQATLTLTVAANIDSSIAEFNNNIIITGTA